MHGRGHLPVGVQSAKTQARGPQTLTGAPDQMSPVGLRQTSHALCNVVESSNTGSMQISSVITRRFYLLANSGYSFSES